ncbi:acyl-CoA thioesterase domain-containing protein [Nocardioides flavescens]|uniref:Thioesterase family protein n=1 Tax=Nocardioides flavescens TaxID=2691959 RepID=A0A6L7F1A6_9ACTN|nr:thioesterase family protein [Nocardioides flavescens]
MAYFHRTGVATYLPGPEVGGAWRADEQHIAPALGLLAHVVERDHLARRGEDRLVTARLSYDIWGTVPIEEVATAVRVVRAGRTVELVEAELRSAGDTSRTVATLRTWLVRRDDTGSIAAAPYDAVPGPDDTPAWDPTTVWPGGFIESVEVRREQVEPGRAVFWVRTPVPLLSGLEPGERVSTLAARAGLLDIVNGMTVRADPALVAFPNVDLTAHLLRESEGEWLGFDTRVAFGPTGAGVTSAVLHDETGPLGTVAQALTVRP